MPELDGPEPDGPALDVVEVQDQTAVAALLEVAGRAGSHGFFDAASTARGLLARAPDRQEALGCARLVRAGAGWAVDVVVDPRARTGWPPWAALLQASVDLVGRDGGGPVRTWVHDASAEHDAVATAAGLHPDRDLYQMRRRLPSQEPSTLPTRPFVVGRDEERWLEVNNRSFAGHPDQGGWSRAQLEQREAEDWFDPAGFLLHEREGRLAGFCWTKVHHEAEPALGELYVVGVDPDFQGLGLGRQLVLAGLAWLSAERLAEAILYVDASNRAAVHLYESLGFTVHHVDRAYVGVVPPISEPSP